MSGPVRVVYADDNVAYRTRLLRSLLADSRIVVVAVVVDGQAALDAILEHKPDVALLDLSTPGLSALEIAERLGALDGACATRLLLLASLPLQYPGRVFRRVGLAGVIDRAMPRDGILSALTIGANDTAQQRRGQERRTAPDRRAGDRRKQ